MSRRTRIVSKSWQTPRCPTTNKLCYARQKHAEKNIAHSKKVFGSTQTHRSYHCPFCNFWHITTKPLSKTP